MPDVSDVALAAHCRRVAGWATEAAQSLECSTDELHSIEKAALLHHDPALAARPEALNRIASDLRIEIEDRGSSSALGQTSLAILEAFHGRAVASERIDEVARVLEWADQFDQEFELRAIDPPSSEIAPQLRLVDSAAVLRAGHTLPVFPTIAQRAIRVLRSENAGLEQVEEIVSNDQVLTAELLKIANTALNGPLQRLTTIRSSIAHVGVGAAIRAISAVCLRPVFASRNLCALWNHSLEAAQVAEEFALISNCVDPAEAFLAGLIHDIGRLAYSLLSCDYQARNQRLEEHGCPPLLVEQALTGTCHAEIGAELLRVWSLPAQFVDAVKYHHEPQESAGPLAAILYATELRTMPDEDLPSLIRLDRTLKMLNIAREKVVGAWPHTHSSLGHERC
jgi:putative nucleotidyltransferase with HDIG domain